MTDRPMIFSAPMVRALLDGRKTQTRRIMAVDRIKPSVWTHESIRQFREHVGLWQARAGDYNVWSAPFSLPWQPGDRLWVREAFARVGENDDDVHACPDMRVPAYFKADSVQPEALRWRPSIHMPRQCSRLTLIVEDVRVQRLQEINTEDCIAEGIERLKSGRGYYDPTLSRDESRGAVRLGHFFRSAKEAYLALWEHLHSTESVEANPWVAAISFRVIRANIDSAEARAA